MDKNLMEIINALYAGNQVSRLVVDNMMNALLAGGDEGEIVNNTIVNVTMQINGLERAIVDLRAFLAARDKDKADAIPGADPEK